MKMNNIRSIVFIGAGNVATHLAVAFKSAGLKISCIYARTEESASKLAHKVFADYTIDPSELPQNADIYFITVRDSIIIDVISTLQLKKKLIVHTSGTVSMDILKNATSSYGVFYPLQTFIKERKVVFRDIPVCLEACDNIVLDRLRRLASLISDDVREFTSEQRRVIHLSAVVACNFTNYMYAIAEGILQRYDIPFDILYPLINETAHKIKNVKPLFVQTGPAMRGDIEIIEKHLEMLSELPDYKEIYKLISDSIIKQQKRK
jgi:predicted short-subunit dehydrogenase-like oxidoreductase (DUF2520 family)